MGSEASAGDMYRKRLERERASGAVEERERIVAQGRRLAHSWRKSQATRYLTGGDVADALDEFMDDIEGGE